MKKEKLFELYELIKEWKFIPRSKFNGIKYLTDEEINLIINGKYQRVLFNFLTVSGKDAETRKQVCVDINNAKDEFIALNTSHCAESNSLYDKLGVERYLDIIKMISSVEDRKISDPLLRITDSENLMSSDIIYDLIKTILDAKSTYQGSLAADVAKNRRLFEEGKTLAYAKIISQANGEYQAKYAYDVATCDVLIDAKNLDDIVIMASEITDGDKIAIPSELFDEWGHDDTHLIAALKNIFDELVEVDFWYLFATNPELAIDSLRNDIISNNEEITRNSKVRVRKNTTNKHSF